MNPCETLLHACRDYLVLVLHTAGTLVSMANTSGGGGGGGDSSSIKFNDTKNKITTLLKLYTIAIFS
jgi:hypothetical protein